MRTGARGRPRHDRRRRRSPHAGAVTATCRSLRARAALSLSLSFAFFSLSLSLIFFFSVKQQETALNPVDDLLAADVLLSVLDFMETSPALSQVAATRRKKGGRGGGATTTPATLLLGHSRGAKVSVLAAARETAPTPRIAALSLLDPVNVTRYAPQSPRFPSATAALVAGPTNLASLPVCIVGGGWAHDCAPEGANYESYYAASRGPTAVAVRMKMSSARRAAPAPPGALELNSLA